MSAAASSGTVTSALSLCALAVADLERSVRFYVDGCGFTYEREFATTQFDAAIVRSGSAGVELMVRRDGRAVHHGDSFVKLVISTPDVPQLMASATAHGGTVESPAATLEAFGGITMGMLRDPDGYLVEVVERRPG